jgi:PAS domain S-box-containing protein
VKLTPRFTVAFIVYATALLLVVGLFAYGSGRTSLRSTTISELAGTAQRKETNLDSWFASKEALVSAVASDPAVIETASRLRTAKPNSKEFRSAHDMLVAGWESRLATSGFLQVSLLDLDTGQVLASTNPDDEGTFKGKEPYFLNGKLGSYIEKPHYVDALRSMVVSAASPLNSLDGTELGVLVASLDMETLNAVISRRTDLHQTDEAYLVNSSNQFVTQPRLMTDTTLLNNGAHTEDVAQCLQEKSGVIETSDYRGVQSFVAYRWIPEHQLCLLVKIDQAEALAPTRGFGRTILLISSLALLAAALIAIMLARSMTHPILALKNGVTRLARGEFDLRLPETSHDELGELAAEFNKMAEELAEQQTHLRRRSEQFFSLTLDLLCTFDLSGRLLDLNPAWEQTLGYTSDELRGHLLTNLIHPDDLEVTNAVLHRLTRTKSERFESRFRHKSGDYRWLAWVIVFSVQDQLSYGAARDTTERRSGEEVLRQQTDELARSNRELEQFAHVASHDLQEPLRLVTTNVQHLARRYQGKLDKEADVFIGFALEASNRMKNLLADLLMYSRVGSSSREFREVQLEETLERVMENLKVVMGDSRAVVTHDPLPAVLADDQQMVQVLQNLIDNAIKFHGAAPPRVHIGARKLGERWLLFVRDNGIGIDPQYTERIFVLFQRLHNRDQYPGTGIGLAVSRKIVERHGGRIWVDSEAGKGATFYFTLQPIESWSPEVVTGEVAKPRPKDTLIDRASDLI